MKQSLRNNIALHNEILSFDIATLTNDSLKFSELYNLRSNLLELNLSASVENPILSKILKAMKKEIKSIQIEEEIQNLIIDIEDGIDFINEFAGNK